MLDLSRRDVGRLAVAGSAAGVFSAVAGAQGASAASGSAIAQPGVVVTRYTVAYKYLVYVRSTASLATPGNIVARLDRGVPLVGTYNSTGLWFKVTSGAYAGRWVSSAVLTTAQNPDVINGRMSSADLTALPAWTINTRYSPGVTRYLSRAAAGSYLAMNAAFRAQFGVNLTITEGYRTYATQVKYYKELGPKQAAVPGTSNHGMGNAIDFGVSWADGNSSPLAYGKAYDRWLTANGWKWGFDRPAYMDQGGSKPEWWHYNFTG